MNAMLTLTPIRHRLAPRQTGCGDDFANEINLRAARRRRRAATARACRFLLAAAIWSGIGLAIGLALGWVIPRVR